MQQTMPASLRPFNAEDQEFLFRLYASTRIREIEPFGWPAAQQEAFLRMQFGAQQRWYETMYARAEHHIVEIEGQAIGRMMVLRQANPVVLVDISLLAEYRGQGIGSKLVRALIEECRQSGAVLRLQVLKTNPALRLYQRLGFTRTGEDQMYVQMERTPSQE